MRLKEAVKIIRTIDEQRQALNKIGDTDQTAAAERPKKEHEAAVASLEAQHANEITRLKAELDGLTKAIAAAKEEHESKMDMFDRAEKEASENLERVRTEIRRLTEQLRLTA